MFDLPGPESIFGMEIVQKRGKVAPGEDRYSSPGKQYRRGKEFALMCILALTPRRNIRERICLTVECHKAHAIPKLRLSAT